MQPSSPLRHATGLISAIAKEHFNVPPIIFLFTDGGLDHRITYLSVQLTLISVFLVFDVDVLCACRTAPTQSWKNGLQSVGLMRKECTPSAEAVLKNCNSLVQIRTAVDSKPSLAEEIADSIEPVKMLICQLFQRLSLKEKKIKIGTPATQTEMQRLNTAVQSIEAVGKVSCYDLHQST